MTSSSQTLLTGLIDNIVPDPGKNSYAAIIGATPSKGARSPLLWNAAYRAHGCASTMVPLDVSSERLAECIAALQADERFVGGAIAVPHKEASATLLHDDLSPEAKKIGAVNCLYRSGGRLHGTNTDGEAARRSLEAKIGSLADKRVLLMGTGGAGKAVAAYLKSAVGSGGTVRLSNRSRARAQSFAALIGAADIDWPPTPANLADSNVLVNATTLGSAASPADTPFGTDWDKIAAQLAHLPADACVYDIIYDPAPTTLLACARAAGRSYLDGKDMNLRQAILAFAYANPGFPADTTAAAMAEAARALQ